MKAISAIHHPKIMDLHLWRVRCLRDSGGTVLRQLVRDCPMLAQHNMLQHLDQEAITKIRLAS
ncbi:hypothetical protein BCR42DRAFT_442876 [Absidia repens]|uniref:Uncharacterized protein n=1 Tax=Absidia repens TaxID=90262 RepID=A0A1X2I1F0_9FUNG|nr:hypothetical protein BCR42DRAFT_442876 [Absidia repens]